MKQHGVHYVLCKTWLYDHENVYFDICIDNCNVLWFINNMTRTSISILYSVSILVFDSLLTLDTTPFLNMEQYFNKGSELDEDGTEKDDNGRKYMYKLYTCHFIVCHSAFIKLRLTITQQC